MSATTWAGARGEGKPKPTRRVPAPCPLRGCSKAGSRSQCGVGWCRLSPRLCLLIEEEEPDAD